MHSFFTSLHFSALLFTAFLDKNSSSCSDRRYENDYSNDYDYEYLEGWELEELTNEQLRIARNEIFARHGRIFKDAYLKNYFESKSWYYPQYDPDEFDAQMQSILNNAEKNNIEMIKNEERNR